MDYSDWHARKSVLVEYLKMKVEEEDWHGVADAAIDIRELEAYREGRKDGANRN